MVRIFHVDHAGNELPTVSTKDEVENLSNLEMSVRVASRQAGLTSTPDVQIAHSKSADDMRANVNGLKMGAEYLHPPNKMMSPHNQWGLRHELPYCRLY